MLKINNLGVSILYVDAFSFTQMLHRTKHELNWLSGVVGCGAQIEFTQKLHRPSSILELIVELLVRDG